MRAWTLAAFLFWTPGCFTSVSALAAPLQWSIYPIAQRETNSPVRLYDVAFGNDRFVGIENSGGVYLASVDDPTTWKRQSSFSEGELRRVKFANGRFLVIGNQSEGKGYLYSSTDGTDWTRKEFESANDVAYGNGWYVVVGDGFVARSTNAVDWLMTTNFASASRHWFRRVSFVNGEFIATFLGDGNFQLPYIPTKLAVSQEGANWEEHSLGGESYSEVAYGRGKYVSMGLTDTAGGWPYHSDDGRGWTEGSYPVRFDGYAVDYANGVFAIVGWNGGSTASSFMSSTNGVTWEEFGVAPAQAFGGLTFDGQRFVAVGYSYEGGNGVVAVSGPVGSARRISNLAVNAEGLAFDFDVEESTEWEVEFSKDLVNWMAALQLTGTPASVERINVERQGESLFVRLKEKR